MPRLNRDKIKDRPPQPRWDLLGRAHQIVCYAHESAESLLEGFNELGKERGRGAPSTEQQDLLRAMLLFACAGLDSCAKELVTSALPELVRRHLACREYLVAFASRRLRAGDSTSPGVDAKFLAWVLVGEPESNLIAALVKDLTGSSLQSTEELSKVAAALGAGGDSAVRVSIDALREAFQIRNQIAHEMDVNFERKGQNRNPRRRQEMVQHTNRILQAADSLLAAVDSRHLEAS